MDKRGNSHVVPSQCPFCKIDHAHQLDEHMDPQMVYCDELSGGCGEPYLVSFTTEITNIKTYVIKLVE